MSKYLLLNYMNVVIVKDGPQAVGVSCSIWIQAEVQGNKNRGEFIPEVLLILHTKKHSVQFLEILSIVREIERERVHTRR